MNKNTKIWLNYLLGGGISVFLLWRIYLEVMKQVSGLDGDTWKHTGPAYYLLLTIALMLANSSLEGLKWHMLSKSVEPITYSRAFASYLAGIAFAVITPNRIGEYPGRILYLGRNKTLGYINVSVLGVVSQLWAVYLFGLVGLIYYNISYTEYKAQVALVLCITANLVAVIFYWRLGKGVALMEKIRSLRRFAVYGKLLARITARQQTRVLAVSILRFVIFTAQYLFLLRWMNVDVPIAGGFCMGALFFWVIAVIPSVALTELGVRGSVCLYLFHHFSSNTVGMLAATAGIWLINLVFPAIIGSILIFRMRLLS